MKANALDGQRTVKGFFSPKGILVVFKMRRLRNGETNLNRITMLCVSCTEQGAQMLWQKEEKVDVSRV